MAVVDRAEVDYSTSAREVTHITIVAERESRRAALQAREDWQQFLVRIQPLIHTQQNRILVPTPFSPIA